jgi:hypothetical protein
LQFMNAKFWSPCLFKYNLQIIVPRKPLTKANILNMYFHSFLQQMPLGLKLWDCK